MTKHRRKITRESVQEDAIARLREAADHPHAAEIQVRNADLKQLFLKLDRLDRENQQMIEELCADHPWDDLI